jgi:hypothetical protein
MIVEAPELKFWKTEVEELLKSSGHAESDYEQIIHTAQDYMDELNVAAQFMQQQNTYLNQIISVYAGGYRTRFGKDAPPRPPKEIVNEILLNTAEVRKQTVREIALSLTKPGDTISDEAILGELHKRSMRFVGVHNQTATISTIVYGFKTEFEKTEKRGVYRRKINQEQK